MNCLHMTWVLIFFFSLSFRSWSSQTSLRCFTVFMLFLLPKLLAWTRCLWRAKATRLPLGFPLFPVSHVIHRHRNSNMPLDRHCPPQTPSRRTLHFVKWWPGQLENARIMALWRAALYSD